MKIWDQDQLCLVTYDFEARIVLSVFLKYCWTPVWLRNINNYLLCYNGSKTRKYYIWCKLDIYDFL